MALSPIKMFQSNENSLQAILSGGNRTVSSIMDQAIQIGRDMSNRQLQQERDMLQMRQQETALSQRRAENLQQGWKDSMNFARRAFEYGDQRDFRERKFESDTEFRDEQFDEQKLQNLFGRSLANEKFGFEQRKYLEGRKDDEGLNALRQRELELRGRGLDLQEQELEGEQADRTRTRSLVESLFATGPAQGEGGTTTTQTVLDIPEETRRAAARGNSPLPGDPSQQPDRRVRAAELLLSDPAASVGQRRAAERVLMDAGVAVKPQTAADKRAQESLEMRKEDRASKQAEAQMESFLADTTAFLPQQVSVVRKYGDPDKVPADELALAQSWDKDRLTAEQQAAQTYSQDEYIRKGGGNLTEAQKKKRKKFWELANKGLASGGSEEQNEAQAEESPVDTFFKQRGLK